LPVRVACVGKRVHRWGGGSTVHVHTRVHARIALHACHVFVRLPLRTAVSHPVGSLVRETLQTSLRAERIRTKALALQRLPKV